MPCKRDYCFDKRILLIKLNKISINIPKKKIIKLVGEIMNEKMMSKPLIRISNRCPIQRNTPVCRDRLWNDVGITHDSSNGSPFKKWFSATSYLKRIFSSRSKEGSSVMRPTSSCMQWSCERKSRSLWFCALHSCSRSSSSISSFRVTSSRSSSWSMWEVVCRSNFQNMATAARGSTCLDKECRQL